MSEDNQADTSCVCDSCGIAESDDIKLKDLDDCDLIRYCSDECLQIIVSVLEEDEDCKKREAELEGLTAELEEWEKRVAEARDKLLFQVPESSHMGDCPICMIPLPIYEEKSYLMPCCSKVVCFCCRHAQRKREAELRLPKSCPFCREALCKTREEYNERRMKRLEMNDPVALRCKGSDQYDKGDYSSAFEYWRKAAVQGDAEAHHKLAYLYHDGDGVEKDMEKVIQHLKEAAMAGHPEARYKLGWHESNDGNIGRAVKHFLIGATQGEDVSIKTLMEMFKDGLINKDALAYALRAHKAAVDETKSEQRDAADEYRR